MKNARNWAYAGVAAMLGTSVYAQDLKPVPAALPTPAEVLTQQPTAVAAEPVNVSETPAPPSPFENTLTGNWGGARDTLAARGFTFKGDLTQFYQGVTSGGVRNQFQYGGKANYYLNLDGEKAGLWKGSFFNMYAESRYGQAVNADTGALFPVNTAMLFPARETITTITELKYTQFLSENLAVFAGKLNMLNGDSLRFMNAVGAKGIDGFQNMGLAFNSILLRQIPYSTLGAGAIFLSDGQPFGSVMVLDATDHPTTSGLNDAFSQGAVVLGEVNMPLPFEQKGYVGIGGAYSTRKYASLDKDSYILDFTENGPRIVGQRESGSWSIYGKLSQALWTSACDPDHAWGFFTEGGYADKQTSPVEWYMNAGIGGNNPYRKQDTFGFGWFYVGLSPVFQNSLAALRIPTNNEQGIEFFYNAGVTPWFHLTPDIQIVYPARDRVDTSITIGLRAKLDF